MLKRLMSTTMKPCSRNNGNGGLNQLKSGGLFSSGGGGGATVPDLCAADAYQVSGYNKIDWRIAADATAKEAIDRMSRNNIGALAVTQGRYFDTPPEYARVLGILTERDILTKMILLGKDPETTPVRSLCTYGIANLVMVKDHASVDECMTKMLQSDCRHLLIRGDSTGEDTVNGLTSKEGRERDEGLGINITGIISIKDAVRCCVIQHSTKVARLADVLHTLGLDQLSHCEEHYLRCTVTGTVSIHEADDFEDIEGCDQFKEEPPKTE